MAERPVIDLSTLALSSTVVFVDGAGAEYPVALPRQGHTDHEVRAVAYRWACQKVARGEWRPYGELAFARMGRSV